MYMYDVKRVIFKWTLSTTTPNYHFPDNNDNRNDID